jgi:hypothetical protein
VHVIPDLLSIRVKHHKGEKLFTRCKSRMSWNVHKLHM